jgi:hypothetical protein
VNHGVELNTRLSRYTPIPSPINMESATDKPILLKYASSFMERMVFFFMKKNALLNKDGSITKWNI